MDDFFYTVTFDTQIVASVSYSFHGRFIEQRQFDGTYTSLTGVLTRFKDGKLRRGKWLFNHVEPFDLTVGVNVAHASKSDFRLIGVRLGAQHAANRNVARWVLRKLIQRIFELKFKL